MYGPDLPHLYRDEEQMELWYPVGRIRVIHPQFDNIEDLLEYVRTSKYAPCSAIIYTARGQIHLLTVYRR